MRIRDKSLQPICRINVAGLASVMLALVCLAMNLTYTHGVSSELPRVTHDRALRDALREDALSVAVQRDGAIFFRNDRVRPEVLSARLQLAMLAGARDTVYIRADKRTKYAAVGEALNAVHAAGITKVAILTESSAGPLTYCCQ
jgi:biopolymer transport protein ExbD